MWRIAREEGNRPGSFFFHVEDGLHYHESYARDGTVYYKCIRYPRCPGRALFDPVDGFHHTIPHRNDRVCRPDILYPQECELRRNILERCRRLDYAPFSRIIREEAERFDNIEVRARVTEARMRSSMRSARNSNYPDLPPNLRSLSMILMNPQNQVITMSRDGEDNVYAGSVTDVLNSHHVVFISQRMVEQMKALNVLHCDGTFKVVPAGLNLEQVFCIVGVWRHSIVPLAWALMESRTTEAYEAVLQLKSNRLGPEREVTRFIMDFESAEILAVQNVFQCRVQGCLWHLIRRFLTYVSDRGLIRPMRLIEPVRRIIRLTMGIPLLPEHLIRTGFLLVTREAMEEGNFIYAVVRPYLQDIYRLWIRSVRKIRLMCVFGSSQRCNNACESHNRFLREAVGVHPNIYAFINGIVRVEQETWDDLYRLEHGRRVGRARRRTSIANDDRINRLAQDLLAPPGPINAAIMRFLRGACHAMDGVVNEAML